MMTLVVLLVAAAVFLLLLRSFVKSFHEAPEEERKIESDMQADEAPLQASWARRDAGNEARSAAAAPLTAALTHARARKAALAQAAHEEPPAKPGVSVAPAAPGQSATRPAGKALPEEDTRLLARERAREERADRAAQAHDSRMMAAAAVAGAVGGAALMHHHDAQAQQARLEDLAAAQREQTARLTEQDPGASYGYGGYDGTADEDARDVDGYDV